MMRVVLGMVVGNDGATCDDGKDGGRWWGYGSSTQTSKSQLLKIRQGTHDETYQAYHRQQGSFRHAYVTAKVTIKDYM